MRNISRRGFLGKAAGVAGVAVGFPYFVPGSALGRDGRPAPSNRITVGCVGVGCNGLNNMSSCFNEPDCQVVAVCDPWQMQRDKAKKRVDEHYGTKDCATYTDFRDVMARDDIDAISNSTPDHWHCLVTLAAARTGKHVHHEKAMCLTVEEDIAVREAVNRYGVVFQFGTEQRSFKNQRLACELVRNGRIGKLHTIKVGSPTSLEYPVQAEEKVPDGFDYEMWLGPAPLKPYSWHRCRPYFVPEGVPRDQLIYLRDVYGLWYHISDYCQGFVAGWGIHYIDIAQWGNGTDDTGPVEVDGAGVFPADGMCDCATSWKVNMKYENGVKLIYGSRDRVKLGLTFEGTEGSIFIEYGSSIEANPKSILDTPIGPDEIHLYDSPDHFRNFFDCIKSGKKTVAPVEQAVRSDTICHLANIAIKLGRKLNWDPRKERFVNDVQANRMLSRTMRSPWHL